MNRISKQILQSPQFFPKIVVAALLIYSLIGIPLFVGYIARHLHQFKERGHDQLPQWNNWLALVVESWELLVITIVYGAVPMVLTTWISSSIDQWFTHVLWIPLWPLPWIPTMLLYLLCPIWVALAYIQYLKKGTFESVLNIREMIEDFRKSSEEIIVMTLLLWGVLLIGFPFFGFTIAAASLIYLTIIVDLVETHRYR